MVSTRPSPAPPGGRIPYPTADTLAPGDAGVPPSAAGRLDVRRGSTPAETTSPTRESGLQRLRSMRDRVRDRSRDRTSGRERTSGRDRSGSVAVAMLAQNREHRDRDKESKDSKDSRDSKDSSKDKDKPHDLSDREKSTQGLKNWWKSFSQNRETTPSPPPYQPPSFRRHGNTTTTMNTRKVFGAPLGQVLTYASMQISTSAPDGSLYVWGEVPIIVGRCGAYLKNKADIEGLFRISGSAKRMRDLQTIFDDPPTFGADIDWAASPFTPHDVATMFRRYLTHLPEPVIPLAFYDQFRSVQANDQLDADMKIREYKRLIRALPTAHQSLLLYTLDLLGIVDKHSDKNLMHACNLALIFQPCLLGHPGHEMRPNESMLSREVVEFLITHQHQFVLWMAVKLSRRTHHGSRKGSVGEPTRKGSKGSEAGTRGRDKNPKAGPSGEGGESTALPATGAHGQDKGVEVTKQPGTGVRPSLGRLGSADSTASYVTALAEQPTAPTVSIPAAVPESETPPLASPTTATTALTELLSTPAQAPHVPSSPTTDTSGDRPKPVRADTDYILPSDSDDEAPPGGYFIVEARPPSASPRAASPKQSTAPSAFKMFNVQELIPPKPPKVIHSPTTSPPPPVTVPAIDVMDPSDSDDEAPSGGYLVVENPRPSSSSPGPALSPKDSLSRAQTARSALRSAEGRTNSPKSDEGASDLRRRKTLPTKRVSDFTARMRRAVREA